MLYLAAVVFPPAAVLACGKPVQAVLNFFLCFLLYIPGLIHAIMVVNAHLADERAEQQSYEMKLEAWKGRQQQKKLAREARQARA